LSGSGLAERLHGFGGAPGNCSNPERGERQTGSGCLTLSHDKGNIRSPDCVIATRQQKSRPVWGGF
jgi:hypothetical protein